jgi:hypothetical protein
MRDLFTPMLVQLRMTFALLLATGISRTLAIRSRAVRVKDVALGQQAWPERVTQIGNSFNNQLQMPILFYLAVAFAHITHADSRTIVLSAWAYVVCRMAHAAIHVTNNRVPLRFLAFALSNAALVATWVQVAAHVYA